MSKSCRRRVKLAPVIHHGQARMRVFAQVALSVEIAAYTITPAAAAAAAAATAAAATAAAAAAAASWLLRLLPHLHWGACVNDLSPYSVALAKTTPDVSARFSLVQPAHLLSSSPVPSSCQQAAWGCGKTRTKVPMLLDAGKGTVQSRRHVQHIPFISLHKDHPAAAIRIRDRNPHTYWQRRVGGGGAAAAVLLPPRRFHRVGQMAEVAHVCIFTRPVFDYWFWSQLRIG